VDDGSQVELFGREHGKTFLQIKPHLVAEATDGSCSRAVFTQGSVGQQMIQ